MAKGKRTSTLRKTSARTGTRGTTPAALIDDLVIGNRILYDQNIVDGYGHISARDPRDPARFLMSRARAPGLVTAADIMVFGLDGEPIKDDGRPIYSERFIHSEIYKARPDVHSVVHSHSPTVIPFSVTQVPLKPIRAPFFYPEVPVFEIRDVGGWTNLLISDGALGAALAQTLGQNSVALLRGHGNVVVGPTASPSIARSTPRRMRGSCLKPKCWAARSPTSRPRRLRSWKRTWRSRGPAMATTAPGRCGKRKRLRAPARAGADADRVRTWSMFR
jgi:ribulose-5-phosphate 4-epimerase/fuculose-1-phosphate aldolase